MNLDPNEQLLIELLEAQIRFIVVGGLAAVLPILVATLEAKHQK